jgi:large subunit ribosomal protein L15
MGRTRKLRGKRTHGRGKKAGRGAGLRGGRGKAGLHKHKFMSMLKNDPDHFGDSGFKRHPSLTKRKNAVNIAEIEERMDELIEKGVAKKDKDTIEVDLKSVGVEKLLGRGNVTRKLRIIVPEASSKAESKIVEAGGSIEKEEE